MSDETMIHRTSQQPAILLAADDYDRLMELASSAASRQPANESPRLIDELYRANIVPAAWMPSGIVRMDAYVEYRDDSTDRVRRVQVVYPHRADIDRGRISVLSPAGTALIGLAEGQSFSWATGTGRKRRLTVLRVSSEPFGGLPNEAA